MVCWLLGRLGCLAAWVICWVFSRLGHAVWCLHLVVFGAVCRCMLCDVMSMGTHVIAAILREGGGGADKQSLHTTPHHMTLCCSLLWCVIYYGVELFGSLGYFHGFLSVWGMLCGVCTLWCVVRYAVVCSVMSCLWLHVELLPFQGEGGGW